MIYLHHLEQSRSNRIVWLLEALDIDYEIIHYQRDPKTYGAPESLKQIHPLGKSPVITDGELVIAESGAIIEYLIDVYDPERRLKPTSGQALLDYRYWLHFAEGSLMLLLVMRLVLSKAQEKRLPFFIKPVIRKFVDAMEQYFIEPRLTPQLELINAFLEKHQWFAGEQLSGADIQMMLPLQFAKASADFSLYPYIERYLAQVKQLESFKKAMEKV
ncbi:glutathione S-transferase [Vibrio sp. PP-XX7]